MTNQKSNSSLKAAVAVAILALFGANIYQFMNNKSLKEDNEAKTQDIIELDSAKSELDKQYQQSIADLNSMKTDNEELNKSIEVQKEELRLQKEKISVLLKDSKNLKTAKSEMNAMKVKAEEYIAEINRLKGENEKLSSSNKELLTSKDALTSEVEKKNVENQKLTEVNSNLSTQKDEISKEKEMLSRKYNRAAAIQVAKLDATGYQTREGKKPSSKSRASDVDFIEVCFKTTENKNSDAGNETFYIRIISPTGETQSIGSEGSGTLTNNATDAAINYSTTAVVDYKNDELKTCGKFSNPGSFQKGVYQIEVYNKGYLVGTTTMKLK
ncbi:MAG: hypothetical protein HOP11_04690 [Saprospiraceae bacterium]|nr:hypothetical protein [Saprospiraceae bacterium]